MGKDGNDNPADYPNATIGRDAYGYVLNYFTGDYRSIARTFFAAPGLPVTSMYNSNISGATYSMQTLSPQTLGYVYTYDQLNRYVGDTLFKNPGTNTWATRTGINDLKEKVSYDENGNTLSYLRHGNTAVGPLAMDSLTYDYNLNTNQLREVNDAVPATNYTVDIDNETSKHNYRYNSIGELASDSIAGIDSIYWTVYGKVHKIVKTDGDSIVFFYDPIGNRLELRNFPHSGTGDTTKYIRDGQGNIMAIYDRKKDTVRLSEFDIYGTKRIGSLDTVLRMQKFITGHGTLDSLTISYLERQKQYELDNYLGNVMVTVSDGKTPVDTDLLHSKDTAYYYTAIVVNAQDYYPFGMVEPGRGSVILGDSLYQFGFNGKMHDNNIYGKENSYDYGMRFYDPRLGRFMSIDPFARKFPHYSPYMYAGDKPICAIDLDGLEDVDINIWNKTDKKQGPDLKLPSAEQIASSAEKAKIAGLCLMALGVVVAVTTVVETGGAGGVAGAEIFEAGEALASGAGTVQGVAQIAQGKTGEGITTILLSNVPGKGADKVAEGLITKGEEGAVAMSKTVLKTTLIAPFEALETGLASKTDSKAQSQTATQTTSGQGTTTQSSPSMYGDPGFGEQSDGTTSTGTTPPGATAASTSTTKSTPTSTPLKSTTTTGTGHTTTKSKSSSSSSGSSGSGDTPRTQGHGTSSNGSNQSY